MFEEIFIYCFICELGWVWFGVWFLIGFIGFNYCDINEFFEGKWWMIIMY